MTSAWKKYVFVHLNLLYLIISSSTCIYVPYISPAWQSTMLFVRISRSHINPLCCFLGISHSHGNQLCFFLRISRSHDNQLCFSYVYLAPKTINYVSNPKLVAVNSLFELIYWMRYSINRINWIMNTKMYVEIRICVIKTKWHWIFSLYADYFFHLSLTRLLPDLSTSDTEGVSPIAITSVRPGFWVRCVLFIILFFWYVFVFVLCHVFSVACVSVLRILDCSFVFL